MFSQSYRGNKHDLGTCFPPHMDREACHPSKIIMPNKPFPILLFVLGALCCLTAANSAHAGWSEPVRISEPGGGYYPQIIAQGDTLHVIYENSRNYDKVDYLRSSDGGLTWAQRIEISDRANTSAHWNPLIVRNGIRLMAIWHTYVNQGVYHENIAYSISNNNGLAWSSPGYILDNNLQWGFTFAASASGPAVNIMAECSMINDTAYFSNIRSTNFGQSWSAPRPVFNEVFNSIPDQISFGNYVHFVWPGFFSRPGTEETYYIGSTDGGVSWGANIPLSDTDHIPSYSPSICVNERGIVRLSWMDFKYSPHISTGDIFLRSSADSGLTWSPEIQVTHNHLALRSDIVSLEDTVYLVWEDFGHENGIGGIYMAKSTDGGISWDEPYWVDGDSGWSYNPSIAASNGRAYIIWYDWQLPDSSGLYFSRWDPEPDKIIEGDTGIPEKISLSAYPNPFNSSVLISVQAQSGGFLCIYDLTGREIWRCKLDDDIKDIRWGAINKDGKGVPSGIYLARLRGDGGQSARVKLVYLK